MMKKTFKKVLSIVVVMLMVLSVAPISAFAWDNNLTFTRYNGSWDGYEGKYAAYLYRGVDFAKIVLKEVDSDGVINVQKGENFSITLSCGYYTSAEATNNGATLPNTALNWHYGSDDKTAIGGIDGKNGTTGNVAHEWYAYLDGNYNNDITASTEGSIPGKQHWDSLRSRAQDGGVNEAYGVWHFTPQSFPQLNTPGVYTIRLAPTITMDQWKTTAWWAINGWGRFDYDKSDLSRTIEVTVRVTDTYNFVNAAGTVVKTVSGPMDLEAVKSQAPANTATACVSNNNQINHTTTSYSWDWNNVYPASGTTYTGFFTSINSGSRGEANVVEIASDGSSGNTSVGILEYDISRIPSDVSNVKLNLDYNPLGFSGQLLYFIPIPNRNGVGNSPNDNTAFSSIFGSCGFGGNNSVVYNTALNYFFGNTTSGQIICSLNQTDMKDKSGQNCTKSLDITNYVKSARQSGNTTLTLMAIIPNSNNNGGNGGWSDIEIHPNSTNITWGNGTTGSNIHEVATSVTANCTWNAGVITTAATCTENGVKTFTCSVCGGTKTEPVTASGHSFTGAYVYNNGQHARKCANCSAVDTYTDCTWNYVSAGNAGHVKQCAVCGHTENTDHNWDVIDSTPASCGVAGTVSYKCSDCNDVKTENDPSAPALEHDYVLNQTLTAPGCTDPGWGEYKCSKCGTIKNQQIPATGVHTTELRFDLANKQHYEFCTSCNQEMAGTRASCEFDVERTVEPGCTTTGTDVYTCAICAGSYEETVDALTHNYVATVVAPKCEEQGYTTHVCSRCGDHYEDTYVPAAGHTWDSGIVTTEPTCTVPGVKTFKCTVAGCDGEKTEPVAALTHDYVDTVVPPTCVDAGYTMHICSRGDHEFMDTPVPATGHSWNAWTDADVTTPATCYAAGSRTRYCANGCGESQTEAILQLTHNYVDNGVATAAGCTENGVMNTKCTLCGDEKTRVIEALGHIWGEVSVAIPATCTEPGLQAATCQRCGDHQGAIVIDPLGHDIVIDVVAKPATCTQAGWTGAQHCTRCNDATTTSVPENAKGHDDYVYTAAKAATCEEAGWTAEIRCHNDPTEVLQESTPIPATGHNYTVTTTEATCTTGGYTTHVCQNPGCASVYTDGQTPALGHDWDEGTVISVGSCTTAGSKIFTCGRCSTTRTENTPAPGHTWDEGAIITNPTCTTAGSKKATCTVCGTTNTVAIPPVSHQFTSVNVPATCTKNGYTQFTCSNCGESYQGNIIPATGHTNKTTIIAPTCTEQGYTRYECTSCGVITRGNYVAATGHTYTERTIAPTCIAQGYVEYTCSSCGHTYKGNLVPAIGHDYEDVEVAPTCTENGYTGGICRTCGNKYMETTIPATGHTYRIAERVEPTNTKSGYILYRCDICGDTYKEVLYSGNRALVCATLYGVDGRPLANGKITFTNLLSGESFTLNLDENGYFTQVIAAGEYEVVVRGDGYLATYGTIIIDNGNVVVDIPAAEINPCDCYCHQNNFWAKLYRIIVKILRLLRINIQCCECSEI